MKWPDPLADAALHGLAGRIVRTIEPHTEADPVAILLQTLAAYGSAIGRASRYRIEADDHRGNLFVALVGSSAKGRKGTSFGRVRELFARADPAWCDRIVGGLSSGEGLIWAVRDPVTGQSA